MPNKKLNLFINVQTDKIPPTSILKFSKNNKTKSFLFN